MHTRTRIHMYIHVYKSRELDAHGKGAEESVPRAHARLRLVYIRLALARLVEGDWSQM